MNTPTCVERTNTHTYMYYYDCIIIISRHCQLESNHRTYKCDISINYSDKLQDYNINYQIERDTQLNLPDLSSRHLSMKFSSLNLAPVAQMIEHLTSNQKVLGSGPDVFLDVCLSLFIFSSYIPSHLNTLITTFKLKIPFLHIATKCICYNIPTRSLHELSDYKSDIDSYVHNYINYILLLLLLYFF